MVFNGSAHGISRRSNPWSTPLALTLAMNRYLKSSAWFAVAIAAFVVMRSFGAAASQPRVPSETAHQLVAGGAKLVDVRTRAEFESKHLPNAINVPLQELADRVSLLEPKDQPLVIYCRSGHRSGLAVTQLKQAGFTRLYDLGPMTAW